MDKEDRREFLKFFIRLAEIMFAVMIAAPSAGFVLGKDVTRSGLLWGAAIGLAGSLIFLCFAFILARRWK
ncbi:MAG: hypothetical protein HYY13_02095 [Nitrospirae bacterium]|nr:hypothetical protein [Nitrospirota bacterium]